MNDSFSEPSTRVTDESLMPFLECQTNSELSSLAGQAHPTEGDRRDRMQSKASTWLARSGALSPTRIGYFFSVRARLYHERLSFSE